MSDLGIRKPALFSAHPGHAVIMEHLHETFLAVCASENFDNSFSANRAALSGLFHLYEILNHLQEEGRQSPIKGFEIDLPKDFPLAVSLLNIHLRRSDPQEVKENAFRVAYVLQNYKYMLGSLNGETVSRIRDFLHV